VAGQWLSQDTSVGKLEDYEKLKKENYESLIVLNGVDARIQERLKMFKSASVSEVCVLRKILFHFSNFKTPYCFRTSG
jgi:hypothetical protein